MYQYLTAYLGQYASNFTLNLSIYIACNISTQQSTSEQIKRMKSRCTYPYMQIQKPMHISRMKENEVEGGGEAGICAIAIKEKYKCSYILKQYSTTIKTKTYLRSHYLQSLQPH